MWPMNLLSEVVIRPKDPVEDSEPLMFPVAVISSKDKSPLAVKLPVTFIESLKSILWPPVLDSNASALTIPLALMFPSTNKFPNEAVDKLEPDIFVVSSILLNDPVPVFCNPVSNVVPTYW